MYTQQFNKETSQKAKRDKKKVNTKQLTVIYDAPRGPSFRPNNPAQKEPISGKKINNKYIESFEIINPKTLKKNKKPCYLVQ